MSSKQQVIPKLKFRTYEIRDSHGGENVDDDLLGSNALMMEILYSSVTLVRRDTASTTEKTNTVKKGLSSKSFVDIMIKQWRLVTSHHANKMSHKTISKRASNYGAPKK
jgi:hypothetical protein